MTWNAGGKSHVGSALRLHKSPSDLPERWPGGVQRDGKTYRERERRGLVCEISPPPMLPKRPPTVAGMVGEAFWRTKGRGWWVDVAKTGLRCCRSDLRATSAVLKTRSLSFRVNLEYTSD
jgi:hypothetical protein